MFTVTFYSYKGGVGRTMALANVAALLARSGKRVLIVDFDLEAPGVTSYGPLTAASGKPGIVDYIHEYLRTDTAPDVADFLVECPLNDEHRVWVMPAGDNTAPKYTQHFASIDWGNLYEHRQGYLLLEDMKRQWARYDGVGFDYVLIDSRTGNTDIGGICTRQLPNAVVIMFVPTRQNIDGLVPIVELIRREGNDGERSIDLLFSPSNIPDLFDEDDILGQALKIASAQLSYETPGSLNPPVVHIHHWENMNLLELPLIVQTREKSRLAHEYEELKMAIIGQNAADREGSLYALQRMPAIFEAARKRMSPQAATKIVERASKITRLHPSDGEIAFRAAEIFSEAQDYEKEERSLTDAIDASVKVGRARMHRAVARINLNKKDEALEDLRAVFLSKSGSLFELRPAAQMLRAISKEPVREALEIFAREEVKPRAKIELATLLMQDREHLDLVADSLLSALEHEDVSEDLANDLMNPATLALIGARRFQEAVSLITRNEQDDVPSLFNLAMARWGAEGSAPLDLFRTLSERLSRVEQADANTHQCIALVRAVIGIRKDAFDELRRAEERVVPSALTFSCWTFTRRASDQFRGDLQEMRLALSQGEMLCPPFLANSRPNTM